MKNFFVISLLLLSFSGKTQTFQGGVLLGLTAAQVDGDSYAGFDKLGVQGGVFVTAPLISWLDARLEIRYASRGARNPAKDDNTGAYLLALHYIDLPVLGAVKIKEYGSLEIGLVPGYMFHAAGEDEFGELNEENLVEYRKFDLGTLLGFTVNLSAKASVTVRYCYSIFSIRDLESAGAYYSWFGKIFGNSVGDFNNYLTLGLNYRLK